MVLDVLHDILSWEDGTYSFSNVSPPESALSVSLSTESMLMEAVRRQDELRRYRQKLTDPGLTLSLKELPDPDAPLTEEEKELFGLVDGRHTLGELVAESPFTDFEAYEALFRLVDAGWIEVGGRRTSEAEGVAAPAPTGWAASWRTEAVFAAACLVVIALVQLLAFKTTAAHDAPPSPESDAYANLALRDVRFAVDVEAARTGHAPGTLDALVTGGWLSTDQVTPNGLTLHYEPASADRAAVVEFAATAPR
jgi:hypothetical protein